LQNLQTFFCFALCAISIPCSPNPLTNTITVTPVTSLKIELENTTPTIKVLLAKQMTEN
jgi:hypothetical protein